METAKATRVSIGEALKRLAAKDVPSAYKKPRGNQQPDLDAVAYERRRLEMVSGR